MSTLHIPGLENISTVNIQKMIDYLINNLKLFYKNTSNNLHFYRQMTQHVMKWMVRKCKFKHNKTPISQFGDTSLK